MSNEITYGDCIYALVPGASWSISANKYDSIVWEDNTFTKPTETEILTKKTELENLIPLQRMRDERNFLLMDSDKYALPDFPHSSESKRQEWLTYRQSLRDITSNQIPTLNNDGNIINITWPTKPS